jgi:Holliday junction resolvasome RuvABC endonuclease subunit
LAIDPATRGFGFAVLEGPERLIDWGVKETKTDKKRRTLKLVGELIEWYRPNIIVLEDTGAQVSRRCNRVEELIEAIAKLAAQSNVKTRRVSKSEIREVFAECPAQTKHEIAIAIGKRFPELAPRVPPFRKPWMSEDYRMSIFDAVALALGAFDKIN